MIRTFDFVPLAKRNSQIMDMLVNALNSKIDSEVYSYWDRLGFNEDDYQTRRKFVGGIQMSRIYKSIMNGLNEAIEDAQSENKKLSRRSVTVIPVKEYQSEQIKTIRKSVNMSQKSFASYLGVSEKTVEAWEAGTNHPSGAASRILSMMEMDSSLTERYPFVKAIVQ